MTVRDFGGYQAVLAVHAEGSIEAEKMQVFRSYDAPRRQLRPPPCRPRHRGLGVSARQSRMRLRGSERSE